MSISYAQSYQDIIQKLQEMVGKPAPRFEGKTLAGKSYNSASLKGKIVVLNFWFVGCPPCEEEMPQLNKLTQKFQNRNDVLFISFARTDEAGVRKFLEKTPFYYHTIANAKPIAEQYHVNGYPTQFIIYQNRKITYTSMGGMDNIAEILEAEINKISKLRN